MDRELNNAQMLAEATRLVEDHAAQFSTVAQRLQWLYSLMRACAVRLMWEHGPVLASERVYRMGDEIATGEVR